MNRDELYPVTDEFIYISKASNRYLFFLQYVMMCTSLAKVSICFLICREAVMFLLNG